MKNVFKYLLLFVIVISMGIGCKIIEPTATLAKAEDGQKFYIIKSGTSKGGGPITTSVVAKEDTGQLLNIATIGGESTNRVLLGALTGMPTAAVSNIGAGYFIGRGLRKSGDTYNSNQTSSSGSSSGSNSGAISGSKSSASTRQHQSQGQMQKQEQMQGQLQGQKQRGTNILNPARRCN